MDTGGPPDYDLLGCPCEFSAYIRDMTSGVASPVQYQTFGGTNYAGSLTSIHAFEVETVFSAPPGLRTYQLEVAVRRLQGYWAASFPLHSSSSLSAMTFPFDASAQ